jgi:chromosome segregation ATPase
MTTTDTDTTTATTARNVAMAEGRRADSARRRQRVLQALNDASNAGEEISVSGIARRAGVDRTFLYRHRDLLEQLHATEAQPAATAAGPTVSRASLQTDLLNAQQRTARLAAHIQQLEKRLSETLGEQAWHESGLGTPNDLDQLKQHITMLEQQTADLRLQLGERDQDLRAARAANRELMTQLNAPRHPR